MLKVHWRKEEEQGANLSMNYQSTKTGKAERQRAGG
jgi:hypothetical protein